MVHKAGQTQVTQASNDVPEKGTDRAALESLVLENDLQLLEQRIGKFNFFNAIKIERTEIRHSNFLAFILDPARSHGHGQLFLNALLMDLLKNTPPHLRPLSPIDLDGTQLRDVEVRREWAHLDLLITCSDPELVVVIENKVGSSEHSDQLRKYEQTVMQQYPTARPLFVYLTLDGEEASGEKWVPYSYRDIHDLFRRIRDTYSSSIGDEVLVFLDHYLTLLGDRLVYNAPEIDELCHRIYRNHQRALDLIFERVETSASGVLREAEAALRDDSLWHVFYRLGRYIDFVPKAWLDWLPAAGLDRKDDPRSWFVFRLEVLNGKLDYYVEIRRMTDLPKRREIVQKLVDEGPKFGFKRQAGAIRDNYTRVSGREHLLQWADEDSEPSGEVIHRTIRKKLADVFPKIAGLPTAIQPLLADLAKAIP